MKRDKAIALERMQILIDNASLNLRDNPALAARQASMARKIHTKYRIRVPYAIRIAFCKKCKSFVGYGTRSRIRVVSGNVHVTCGFCGHTQRKILRP